MTSLDEEAKRRPLLQVALDVLEIERAIEVAVQVLNAGFDIIEVGTPLIKYCGISCLKALRGVAGRRAFVVADTKTVDAARLELTPFLESGADGVTVLGLSDIATIEEALMLCREKSKTLIVDLIGVTDVVDRALKLAELGVKVVLLHIGVDVQKRRGLTAKQLLKEVEQLSGSGLVVAVAGGIKPQDVAELASSGARIIIMGSAITASSNPYESAKRAAEILRSVIK